MSFWKELGEELLQLVYPEPLYCMGCGDVLDGGETARSWGLCDRCLLELFSEEVLKRTLKKGCEGKSYSHIIACTVYGGRSRDIIGKFKNNGQPWLGRYIGRLMAQRLCEEEFDGSPARCGAEKIWELVTFVPVHRQKKRLRGYDQAQLLAEQVGRSLGLPWASCLVRTRRTEAMKRMSEIQRKQNVRGAFRLKDEDASMTEKIQGKRILLVDDVVTTGSTADACALELLRGGAREVTLLAFAAAIHGKQREESG